MAINNPLLSRLVLWAAEDQVRGTHPELAVRLGIAKEGDPRLGSWDQGTWGQAERNGVCKTAFCLAGGAVALDETHMIVMEDVGDEWSGAYAIPVDRVPEGVEVKWNYVWLPEDEGVYEFFRGLGKWDDVTSVSTRAAKLLGLNEGDADRLFDGNNTIWHVVTLAVDFAEEDGETLDIPDWVREHYYDPEVVNV